MSSSSYSSSSSSKEGQHFRTKLQDFTTWEDVVEAIKKCKKIIIVTGAGISVSSGIPDFRSKDTGLYNTLDCGKFNIPSAELLFDYEFFKIDPSPFYAFSSSLNISKENLTPSPAHKFIYMLEQKKKLLRNYTQNVDGLEKSMGMCKVIECHGSMEKFKCLSEKCSQSKKLADVQEELKAGTVCYCKCGDVLKPDITFFGEPLPRNFFTALEKDVGKADLILVVGTSLKVGGSVHELLKKVNPLVPQVLINRDLVEPPASFSEGFDVSLLGNCDDIFNQLCTSLSWVLPAASFSTAPPAKPSGSAKGKQSQSSAKGKQLQSTTRKRGRNEELIPNKKTKTNPHLAASPLQRGGIRSTRQTSSAERGVKRTKSPDLPATRASSRISKSSAAEDKKIKPLADKRTPSPDLAAKRASVRISKLSLKEDKKARLQSKDAVKRGKKPGKAVGSKGEPAAVAVTMEIQQTNDRVYRLFSSV